MDKILRKENSIYILLIVLVIITITPFLLMFLGGFKENYEIMNLHPKLLPAEGFDFRKYKALFDEWPFTRNILNSLFITTTTTIGGCFFCALAGFTFAKYKFPGRDKLFVILLASMMVPLASRLVPTYILIRSLGGMNKYWSLIVPGLVPAFGVFLMRQYAYSGIPDSIIEAAKIEGASEWQIFMRIGLPIMKPTIVALAILIYMGSWNSFLWPLVVVTKKEMFTVTVALRALADTSLMANYGVILAAATLGVLPIILIFIIFFKKMSKGTLEGFNK